MDSSILEMSVGPPESVTLNPQVVLAYKEIASFNKSQNLPGGAEAAKGLGSMPHGAGTDSHVLCSGCSGMLIAVCASCSMSADCDKPCQAGPTPPVTCDSSILS